MKFGTIFIDPPWQFDNQRSRAATSNHYDDMPGAEIRGMPIPEIAAEDCHLYLWSTAIHQPLAFECIRSWSFEFKQDIQWVKTRDIVSEIVPTEKGPRVIHRVSPSRILADGEPHQIALQIGLGNYFRHAHERLLFATRGRAPANSHALPTVIFAPREEHSAKPEIFQALAEMLSLGPGLELFARRKRQGWHCSGKEVGGSVDEFFAWMTTENRMQPTNEELLLRAREIVANNAGGGDGADVAEFRQIEDELSRRGIHI
jgi:N6-adenosine-specific RNA methylase IME4